MYPTRPRKKPPLSPQRRLSKMPRYLPGCRTVSAGRGRRCGSACRNWYAKGRKPRCCCRRSRTRPCTPRTSKSSAGARRLWRFYGKHGGANPTAGAGRCQPSPAFIRCRLRTAEIPRVGRKRGWGGQRGARLRIIKLGARNLFGLVLVSRQTPSPAGQAGRGRREERKGKTAASPLLAVKLLHLPDKPAGVEEAAGGVSRPSGQAPRACRARR